MKESPGAELSYGSLQLIESGCSGANSSSSPPELRSKYRPDIDGLRAVAVTSVVIYHMSSLCLPGGFVGVDIFFVISGFVVTGSLLHKPSASVSDYFISFYARRLKRLAPALLVVVAVTGLAMALWIPPWIPQRQEFFLSGVLSLVGWSNNYFAASAHGYFDTAPDTSKNPFTHTWSLAVEEQFYLVFPFLVLLAYGPRAVKTAWNPPEFLSPRLLMGLACCCSAVFSSYLTVCHKTLAFYLMPARLWELMLGALLFDFVSRDEWARIAEQWVVIRVLDIASVSLLVLSLLLTPKDGLFPFPWALVAVAGTACFIAAGTSPRSRFNACLSHDLPVYIGKMSYAVYLWHWPVLVMLDWALGSKSWSFLQTATVVAGILVLAAASYHLVEQPVRRWRPNHHYAVFCALGPVFLFVMLLLYLLYGPLHGIVPRSIVVEVSEGETHQVGFSDFQHCIGKTSCVMVGSGATLAAGGGMPLGGVVQQRQCSCRKADPTLHTPPLSSGGPDSPPCFTEHGVAPLAHDIWDGFKWDQEKDAGEHLKTDRGPAGNKPAIFLIGDSHAVHMRWAFSSDCLPLEHHASHMLTSWADANTWRTFGSRLMAGDVVVLSYQFEKYHKADFVEEKTAWVRNMSAIIRDRQAVLVLLGDVPRRTAYHERGATASGPQCVPMSSKHSVPSACKMSKEEMERELVPMHQMWQELADQPNVFFMNFYQLFCGTESCDAMIPGTGTLAYMDANHMTKAAALYLRPYMCSAMTTALDAIQKKPSISQSRKSLTAVFLEGVMSMFARFP